MLDLLLRRSLRGDAQEVVSMSGEVRFAWQEACGIERGRTFSASTESEVLKALRQHWNAVPDARRQEYLRRYRDCDAVHRAVRYSLDDDGEIKSCTVLEDTLQTYDRAERLRAFAEDVHRCTVDGLMVEFSADLRDIVVVGRGVTAYRVEFSPANEMRILDGQDSLGMMPEDFICEMIRDRERITGC